MSECPNCNSKIYSINHSCEKAFKQQIKKLQQENEKLKLAYDKLQKAVRFYGYDLNWSLYNDSYYSQVDDDGKLARSTLTTVEELMNKEGV